MRISYCRIRVICNFLDDIYRLANLLQEEEERKVEIQIRTQAMNFWAVVEHHFIYKKEDNGKVAFEKDLKECARQIYKIDKKMLLIRKRMEQNYC